MHDAQVSAESTQHATSVSQGNSPDTRLAIITGANTGLGYETALAFAQAGLTVVLACRDVDKGNLARNAIHEIVPDATLHVEPLDLADLTSVRSFAHHVCTTYNRCNILVNNAGVMGIDRELTTDGFEMHMATNYFGHFLLTSLLRGIMPDEPSSRIVTLSSGMHKRGLQRIKFEDLTWENDYKKTQAYSHSKLACLMFAFELDQRLRDANQQVRSVAAHPGISDTDMSRHLPPALTFALRYTISPFISQSAADGATAQIHCALSDTAQGGDYYGPQERNEWRGKIGPATALPYAHDSAARAQLWEISTDLTGATWNFA